VSYVQFYSKHEASYIFKLEQLDLLSLAFHGFGLIKLPKMPELKKLRHQLELVTPDGFEVGQEEFDWSQYSYLDPLKEAQRQEKHKIAVQKSVDELKVKSTGLTQASKPSNLTAITPIDKKILELEQKKLPEKAAWSKKINAKISKEQKRLKRLREKEGGGFKRTDKDPASDNDDVVGNSDDNRTNPKDKGDDDDDDQGETDWKELLMEKKTLKKIKLQSGEQQKRTDGDLTVVASPANPGQFFLGLA